MKLTRVLFAFIIGMMLFTNASFSSDIEKSNIEFVQLQTDVKAVNVDVQNNNVSEIVSYDSEIVFYDSEIVFYDSEIVFYDSNYVLDDSNYNLATNVNGNTVYTELQTHYIIQSNKFNALESQKKLNTTLLVYDVEINLRR